MIRLLAALVLLPGQAQAQQIDVKPCGDAERVDAIAEPWEQNIATYANGDVYEGSFVAGKRQGQGELRYKTGQQAVWEWTNGILTAPAEAVPVGDAPTESAPSGN